MTEKQIDEMLEEFQLVYIDGVALDDPKPSAPYGFSKYEQDIDSGRNMNGVMLRNIMEHHPRKLFLNFAYGMNGRQMKKLLEILDKPVLEVRAFDPWSNSIQTISMQLYHNDLEPKVSRFEYNYDLQEITPIYEAFSVNLIEY